MEPFRLVQISDTHLGRNRSWFVTNFDALKRIIAGLHPDLVVNTGDISFDGTQRKHLGAALCFRVGLPLDLTQSNAALGVRIGLHGWPCARHMDSLGTGCSRGVG